MPLPTHDLRIVRQLRLDGNRHVRNVEDILADATAVPRRLTAQEERDIEASLREVRVVLANIQKVSDPVVRKAERVIEEYHQLREELADAADSRTT